jgi:hypothetical protein
MILVIYSGGIMKTIKGGVMISKLKRVYTVCLTKMVQLEAAALNRLMLHLINVRGLDPTIDVEAVKREREYMEFRSGLERAFKQPSHLDNMVKVPVTHTPHFTVHNDAYKNKLVPAAEFVNDIDRAVAKVKEQITDQCEHDDECYDDLSLDTAENSKDDRQQIIDNAVDKLKNKYAMETMQNEVGKTALAIIDDKLRTDQEVIKTICDNYKQVVCQLGKGMKVEEYKDIVNKLDKFAEDKAAEDRAVISSFSSKLKAEREAEKIADLVEEGKIDPADLDLLIMQGLDSKAVELYRKSVIDEYDQQYITPEYREAVADKSRTKKKPTKKSQPKKKVAVKKTVTKTKKKNGKK